MKIAKLLKKFDRGDSDQASELNDVLDTILRTERRRDDTKKELENARRHLENEQARIIDGDEGADIAAAVSGVVSETAKLESLEGLLKQARNRAVGLIAASTANQRKRLAEVEDELAKTKRDIDERTIRLIADFAKKHGWRVSWPTRVSGGAIRIPSMSIDGDDLSKIADSVVVGVHRDQDADHLDGLHADRQRINLIIKAQPDVALESLLIERRRR